MDPQALSDTEFLAAVESAAYPGDRFGHREHLRLGWLCLKALGFEAGLERIRGLVRHYAMALGAAEKFHETMTRAWAERMQVALEETPACGAFEAFLTAHPELLDSKLLGRHYRKETLDSARARAGWVPPDLEPMPRRAEPQAPAGKRPGT
ncbi:hypothetical protein [Stigmatella erecta]|uniref:Uncharacterized protein n=1 Tax=Stigmatella erecta TaxID=83460 RepID=A0A1H9ZT42_9BACT|nr:hypothetical protein [Stigmatella erecta]SES84523.1 hypothetical protein SAMN05443639_101409 [Stigmatella erecta]